MELKQEIITRLLEAPSINEIFEGGLSFDDKKSKHIKVKTQKVRTGVKGDLDECIITIKSDEKVRYNVEAYLIIKGMDSIADGNCGCVEVDGVNIRKVLYFNEFEHTDGKKQMDIKFHVINNVEK